MVAADLDAAHARHHQVRDHQVRRPVAEEAQALFGIVGRAHIVTLRGKCGAQHPRNLRFVVNYQNSSRHVFLLSTEDYIIAALGISESRWARMIPVGKRMLARALFRADSPLARGHGGRGPDHVFAGLAGRQLHHRGHGVSGAGGVVGHAVRNRSLALHRGCLCPLFDYFFLPPMHTFRLEGAQPWVAMISFAISCVVVSRLAERARRQTLQAEQRQADVGTALRAQPGNDALRGRRPADARPAWRHQPHLRPRGSDSLRLRPRPVLLLDRRSAGQRSGAHARRCAGPESRPWRPLAAITPQR